MKKVFIMALLVAFSAPIVTVALADDDYYKYQQYSNFEKSITPAMLKEGEMLYKQNCMKCHGADGMSSPRRDVAPIAYIPAGKVFKELRDYKTEDDMFDWEEKAMIDVTSRLSYPQLEAIAGYVGTLRSKTTR